MARLTAAETSHYEREGWVIPQFRLPAAQAAAMRRWTR